MNFGESAPGSKVQEASSRGLGNLEKIGSRSSKKSPGDIEYHRILEASWPALMPRDVEKRHVFF